MSQPPDPNSEYNDVVTETVGDITSVQFDGFEASDLPSWEAPFNEAFAGCPKNVLVDARIGYGGRIDALLWLFRLLRGTDQPYGVLDFTRGAYDDPDPSWLFASPKIGCAQGDFECSLASETSGFTLRTAAPGTACKIAWVNGNDVSANDFSPRLLKGRPGLRIFGPHATHGAYGVIVTVPQIDTAWYPGSMQVSDSRFGVDLAAAVATTWESSKGVVPDEIVVQTESDMLANRDTTLLAAKAWLESAP